MNIKAIPNNNHWNGRVGLKAKWLIIHGTAGGTSAQAIANYFKDTESLPLNERVSSHYVIGTDGAIVQCVFEQDAAYANGAFSEGHDAWWDTSVNPNLTTISIEHCKPSTDNSDPLTAAQKASSFQLIRNICQRNGIPMRPADGEGGITGHYSLDPVNRRDCPGPYPWADLWTFLKQGASMDTIPTGWHDDGRTLSAPNGHRIVDGFRVHVLANNWDAANVPLENEVHVPQISLGNTSLGAGQRQLFLKTMLYWTPSTDVKELFVGEELQSCYSIVAALQGHIAQQAIQLQQAQDKAPVVAPVQPAINVEALAAVLVDLRDSKSTAISKVGDALKVACEQALADIGYAKTA